MFNHSHTILLITRQVLARIDLCGRKQLNVKKVWMAPSCDYDSIQTEVVRAVQLGTPRPGRVTIVSSDFWTDVLSIPSDVAAIASGNEINQALALEAEVDSGHSAFDSRTSALPIHENGERSEDRQWCVTQVSNEQIHSLAATLRTEKIKLHGVAHPIAAQFNSSAPATFESVQRDLDIWVDQTTFTLDDIQTLATAWAACLSESPSSPLLILSQSENATSSQPIALTTAVALLAVSGSGLWHWQTQQSLKQATHSIELLEKQQSQNDATEASIKAAEASIVQLRQDAAKAQNSRHGAERQLQLAAAVHAQNNQRWLALVNALSESASENCWVHKLESNSVQTIVHGVALNNADANDFAGRLELALKGSGWRTAPAATELLPQNIIAFKIVLEAMLKPEESVGSSGISSNSTAATAPLALAGSTEP